MWIFWDKSASQWNNNVQLIRLFLSWYHNIWQASSPWFDLVHQQQLWCNIHDPISSWNIKHVPTFCKCWDLATLKCTPKPCFLQAEMKTRHLLTRRMSSFPSVTTLFLAPKTKLLVIVSAHPAKAGVHYILYWLVALQHAVRKSTNKATVYQPAACLDCEDHHCNLCYGNVFGAAETRMMGKVIWTAGRSALSKIDVWTSVIHRLYILQSLYHGI